MRRASHHHRAGTWPAETAADRLVLAFDERHRRRIVLPLASGADLLLDLPRAVAMAHGDGLLCDDGAWIAVAAAPEPLYAVSAPTPHLLLRLAWHLGNRHTPAAVEADRLLIRPDPVLAEMLRGLGGTVAAVCEPFQPEGGAYGEGGHGHVHDEGHDHAHSHGHAHDHKHGHAHDHEHTHAHRHGHHDP
ncbi:MAG: urease accessory protein UreE [Alphaproteobacteria bacterium]|nr:urease accessory protein UreE [Alphaproteobacteria bacterium]